MKSLITGAGGYIGSALAEVLAAAGDELVLHYRNSNPDHDPLRNASVTEPTNLHIDLAEQEISLEQLADVDAVFHCAGIAHQRAEELDYQRVNYEATLNLAKQCRQAGVKRFVFLSSVKAETADTPYGYYKSRTEISLQEMESQTMAVACVRPALVYSQRAPGNLATLIRAVRLGLPILPERGGRSMIARADLVALLAMIGRLDWQGFTCITAADGEQYSTRRLCQAIRQALGRSGDGVELPLSVWRAICRVADIFRREEQPLFDKLLASDFHDNEEACRRFGWQPHLKFEDQVGQMVVNS